MFLNDLRSKFRPSSLNAFERYEALAPILSQASEVYLRIFKDQQSPARDAQLKSDLDAILAKVVNNSPMSAEEALRALQGFMAMGMPGLMTPLPFNAEEFVEKSRGTWELASRYTDGGRTPHARPDTKATRARSHIYEEQVSPTEMKELITMWTDENHFPRDDSIHALVGGGSESYQQTFFIAAFSHIHLNQIDDYTIEWINDSEGIGNHGPFLNPGSGSGRVLMMRVDSSPSFLGIPEASPPEQANTFLLLNAHSGMRTLSYAMSGLPAMSGFPRTLDVVDTYRKISDQQPLVGGWEPIESYYKRLRDPVPFANELVEKTGSNDHVHGFHPDSWDELTRYDQ